MSLRTFSHGTVMWTPLAGRIESGCGALVEGADVVGPHAGGVDDDAGARPSIASPSASTVAPVDLPSCVLA